MLQNAMNDREFGYNCAQTVLKQFCTDYQLPVEQALLLASGFGGGMRMGSVCGAVSGGIMAIGLALGFTDPVHKADIDCYVLDFIASFKETMGCMDCRDLIGIDTCDPAQRASAKEKGIYDQVCPLAISTAIRLVGNILASEKRVALDS